VVLNVAQPSRRRSVEWQARYIVADISDDASSLAAKLDQIDSRRVVVVIPAANRALEHPVAIRVLARAASRQSVKLALVSERRRLRHVATIEGLVAFPSLSSVPRDVEPESLPSPLQVAVAEWKRSLSQGTTWAAAIGLVLVILAATLLIVPHATVYVRPVTDQLSGTVRIQASGDATNPDPTHGIVPGRIVYLVVDSSGSIPVTSKEHPMDGRAVGYITFENRVNQRITVPRGTDLSTFSGVHFQTTKEVVLDDHPGATATVPIVATAPGEFANVQRGQIVVVGGRLRWLITAVNEDTTAGGGPPGEPIVTAWETRKLLDQVMADARRVAQQRLADVVSAGETPVQESIEVTPIEETFNHAIGDKASDLSVHVESRVKALIVNQRDLDNLAMQMWHPQLRSGFAPVQNSISVGKPSVIRVDPSSVTFDVPVRAIAYADVNTQRIAAYVRLRSPQAAERDLDRFFGFAAPPKVTIVPSWMPRAYRVEVVVDTNAPATTASVTQR